MRVKFTIAICALLVLGLAVSEVAAQGYRLAARVNTVVAVPATTRTAGRPPVDLQRVKGPSTSRQNNTIEVTFGGLTITSLLNTDLYRR